MLIDLLKSPGCGGAEKNMSCAVTRKENMSRFSLGLWLWD